MLTVPLVLSFSPKLFDSWCGGHVTLAVNGTTAYYLQLLVLGTPNAENNTCAPRRLFLSLLKLWHSRSDK